MQRAHGCSASGGSRETSVFPAAASVRLRRLTRLNCACSPVYGGLTQPKGTGSFLIILPVSSVRAVIAAEKRNKTNNKRSTAGFILQKQLAEERVMPSELFCLEKLI